MIKADFLDHGQFSQIVLKEVKEMYEDQFEEFVCWHQGLQSCLPIQQMLFQKHRKKKSSLFFTWTPGRSKLAVPVLSGSVWVTQHKRRVTKTDCVTKSSLRVSLITVK